MSQVLLEVIYFVLLRLEMDLQLVDGLCVVAGQLHYTLAGVDLGVKLRDLVTVLGDGVVELIQLFGDDVVLANESLVGLLLLNELALHVGQPILVEEDLLQVWHLELTLGFA